MEAFTLQAMAKVNLGLDVIRRLENGYHQVKMIMQTIDLYDELTFERAETGISLHIDREDLPADESNLIWKAARLIMEEYDVQGGVRIGLRKRIPMAAGLAGGSTDAAAVFHGLNKLFSLGMETVQMQRLGVLIGADVPFCLVGGTMLCEGIGEKLTPVMGGAGVFLVVAKPDISVSTRYVYENLHVETIAHHPDIDSLEAAVRAGDTERMGCFMENILETVTEKKYPVITQLKTQLKKLGAVTALMSGSGPSVFGMFRTREQAEAACLTMKKQGMAKELFVAGFTDSGCREVR